jgi:phosphoglucosamine mutase
LRLGGRWGNGWWPAIKRRAWLSGRTTRESSSWISAALAAALESAQVQVVSAGVITTPGVAYLTRANQFAAGIVISASHNPWQDNGIKIFGADGYKLSDELEHAIEADIFAHIEQLAAGASHAVAPSAAMLPGDGQLHEAYAAWLAETVAGTDFSQLRVLVDCANGAASSIAPLVFRDCGIAADFLHIAPNGRNINAGCGALHPEHVAGAVAGGHGKYNLGVTFDGDADRCFMLAGAQRQCESTAMGCCCWRRATCRRMSRNADRRSWWWRRRCRTWGWKRR